VRGRLENVRGRRENLGGVVKTSGDWQNLREIVHRINPPCPCRQSLLTALSSWTNHLDRVVIHPPTPASPRLLANFRERKKLEFTLASLPNSFIVRLLYTYYGNEFNLSQAYH
jgi:hypothetical protein